MENIKAIILKLYYVKFQLKHEDSIPIISAFKLWINVHINQGLQEILKQINLDRYNIVKNTFLKICPKFLIHDEWCTCTYLISYVNSSKHSKSPYFNIKKYT